MKRSVPKPRSPAADKAIVLGRLAFASICAVEGITLSLGSERMFAEFDRQGLSPEQRRKALLEKHAKKA
ncbi:hypothetical protein [Pleomorphomonas sp. NRK KF1]|uniref:hypothetical protein n=1 Tax=Pleomorphomonas sp. NRK KF1 TaxID=2943000 RepID=UPI002042CF7A|nr:hypothetical protein [Pleomorphomonas sp. NRK KF1]MCM5553938.1 hypothetical protein [Pleomorphomonas sp. NRK KF1]